MPGLMCALNRWRARARSFPPFKTDVSAARSACVPCVHACCGMGWRDNQPVNLTNPFRRNERTSALVMPYMHTHARTPALALYYIRGYPRGYLCARVNTNQSQTPQTPTTSARRPADRTALRFVHPKLLKLPCMHSISSFAAHRRRAVFGVHTHVCV